MLLIEENYNLEFKELNHKGLNKKSKKVKKSLIILGKKHSFTKRELEELCLKFTSIKNIFYANKEPQLVIAQLTKLLDEGIKTVIVLNTQVSVDNSIIQYLSDLKFNQNFKHLYISNLEHFMEKTLYKCYIPSDSTDLSFLEDIKPFTTLQYFQKRLIDFLGVSFLSTVAVPAGLYSLYRIKKEAPGSFLFKQTRVGKEKNHFKCVKFRSMYENAKFDPYTREKDNRIFPWGNIMRKTRIDELPQLLNILKGEMHLIGPRAEWNILVKNYEKEIPYYNERHIVSPGITGWAQVKYPYGANSEDAKQKLMYDLYYIKYWSMKLEIKTIIKTIKVVLGQKGI